MKVWENSKFWVEWMKRICHLWSRGRHFSPSLPGDRYLKLSSQKRSPGRNLGEHRLVRRSGTTSRGTALLVFCLRIRSLPRTEQLTILVRKSIQVGSTKCNPFSLSFTCASFLHFVCLPAILSWLLEYMLRKLKATQVHIICNVKEMFPVFRNIK